MSDTDRLGEAWQRVFDRMVAGAERSEEQGSRVLVEGGSHPTHIFAGTDLPAAHVLAHLEAAVDDMLSADRPMDAGGLMGLAIASFLFGWESRS